MSLGRRWYCWSAATQAAAGACRLSLGHRQDFLTKSGAQLLQAYGEGWEKEEGRTESLGGVPGRKLPMKKGQ